MRFIFPFKDIPKDTKIVLYGASDMGYDFYRQIISTKYCEVVLWVDRQYEWWQKLNLPVEKPGSINDCEYDLIILTAEKKSVADSMRKDLAALGADDDKIFWKEDCAIKGNVVARFDPERIKAESDTAVSDDPMKYVDEDSLDIIVRLLYVNDMIAGIRNDRHEQMYRRLMMVQNGGSEPTENMISGYFTEYSLKSGWEAFDQSFKALITSMQKQGFRRSDFIPLDNKGRMINGRHRLAVAIALGIDVWTRQYDYDGIRLCFDRQWLADNGFTDDEIAEVMEAYHEKKDDLRSGVLRSEGV